MPDECRPDLTLRTSRRLSAAAPWLLASLTLCVVACGGSARAKTQADVSSDGNVGSDVDFDAEANAGWETTDNTLSEEQTNATARLSTPQGPSTVSTHALLGARHDLELAADTPTACKCLSAALGTENNPHFLWSGDKPVLDHTTQMVVGLKSQDGSCDGATSGASYMGYEVQDGDVIVKVEAAVLGRPVTRGAIIPRPSSGKRVLIEAVGGIPYGKSTSGDARCGLNPTN